MDRGCAAIAYCSVLHIVFGIWYDLIMELSEIKSESPEKWLVSKKQAIFLAVVLVAVGVFLLGRQFGWPDAFFREYVTIPSGPPYAEAVAVGAYEGTMWAERVAVTDAQGNAVPKMMEILTDEKIVFAEMTSSGPIKISQSKISEGDIIWIYNRVRTLEEVIAAPADPGIAIPFEDMVKNPRERMRADFVVKVGGK